MIRWYLVALLVGFYGISTLVGYVMRNPVYTYVYQIYMILKKLF